MLPSEQTSETIKLAAQRELFLWKEKRSKGAGAVPTDLQVKEMQRGNALPGVKGIGD